MFLSVLVDGCVPPTSTSMEKRGVHSRPFHITLAPIFLKSLASILSHNQQMSPRKLCFLLPLPVPEDTDFLKATQLVQFLPTEEGLKLFYKEDYFRKFSVDKYPWKTAHACTRLKTVQFCLQHAFFTLPFPIQSVILFPVQNPSSDPHQVSPSGPRALPSPSRGDLSIILPR